MEAMQANTIDVVGRMKEIAQVMKTPDDVLQSHGVTTENIEGTFSSDHVLFLPSRFVLKEAFALSWLLHSGCYIAVVLFYTEFVYVPNTLFSC
jgi:hypothetical protein